MATQPKRVKTLRQLVRHCASWNEQQKSCWFDNPCYVHMEVGEPCLYFEKAVLPTQPHLYPAYIEHCGPLAIPREDIPAGGRFCPNPDCNNELKPRQRFCSYCSKKKRKETHKKYNRKRKDKQSGRSRIRGSNNDS